MGRAGEESLVLAGGHSEKGGGMWQWMGREAWWEEGRLGEKEGKRGAAQRQGGGNLEEWLGLGFELVGLAV